ncbi:hypothetical protein SKAU_G00313450 [Synaphobranchus kaupii]|uniref:Uncharacterized protein n=1 Tax=Synaphobranchus kaupii TaxID=118154 RepID=A0A9Q1ES38_SYNKA|nr:hypothetical protein SKAU_G00313450 [Synaphobranchus kaupii]
MGRGPPPPPLPRRSLQPRREDADRRPPHEGRAFSLLEWLKPTSDPTDSAPVLQSALEHLERRGMLQHFLHYNHET